MLSWRRCWSRGTQYQNLIGGGTLHWLRPILFVKTEFCFVTVHHGCWVICSRRWSVTTCHMSWRVAQRKLIAWSQSRRTKNQSLWLERDHTEHTTERPLQRPQRLLNLLYWFIPHQSTRAWGSRSKPALFLRLLKVRRNLILFICHAIRCSAI